MMWEILEGNYELLFKQKRKYFENIQKSRKFYGNDVKIRVEKDNVGDLNISELSKILNILLLSHSLFFLCTNIQL